MSMGGECNSFATPILVDDLYHTTFDTMNIWFRFDLGYRAVYGLIII